MLSITNTTRSVIFYLLFVIWTICYSIPILLIIKFITTKKRHNLLVKHWALVSINLCRVICGLRWKVHGQENIPSKACVIISNHQSTWETFFLQTIITPQSLVVKRELLLIPFFGWALRAINPIAINRSTPREAIQQVKIKGLAYLQDNVSVLVFPEGTRNQSGKLGKFSRSGALLACTSNVDILPIAHNAGKFWPGNRWIVTPGTIQVFIGHPIKTSDKDATEANNAAREWICSKI
ncbi:MAG: lysophospholipid acyltransferase family protein [Candidatus Endonucleobacter bathymodioli]|uniref:Lysophospholipid acyltransferase family protein n=1 Tax=Candidatus Endonucleibacter bathymodioli TaxID=539814 RepID=A0AA90NK28_9GAMM|nr:lysophospholipid acyltransferase family protein [Candidatus Endonucleobacter bathymodioli]